MFKCRYCLNIFQHDLSSQVQPSYTYTRIMLPNLSYSVAVIETFNERDRTRLLFVALVLIPFLFIARNPPN